MHRPSTETLAQKVDCIAEDVRYLRDKLDDIQKQFHGLMWKVIAIGAGSGALGFVVALVFNQMV